MTKLSTGEARQGERGRPVLMVLIAGLVLAGVAAFVLYPFQQDAGTISDDTTVGETVATDR